MRAADDGNGNNWQNPQHSSFHDFLRAEFNRKKQHHPCLAKRLFSSPIAASSGGAFDTACRYD
ncbi:MAG: hypothetical protein ACRELY_03090, partial [Polyangiaceae bacterium]